jgi:hypothetical protein
MNPRVQSVVVEPGYTLRLTFANGEQRRLQMTSYLDVPVFRRLRDPAFFALARAAHGTVTWPGGIDFDPDTLYLEGEVAHASEGTTA